MSETAVEIPVEPVREKSFVAHAKLISALTLLSRVLGLAREGVWAHYFGTGLVSSAFTTAFAIPNLFRKLFGEGALSAAFIPLYAQAIKQHHESEARRFAAASVNLLCLALLGITILGEIILFAAIALWPNLRPDWLLTLKLTAIMLPYVLLICGAAFLSSILQVHRRFGAPAAVPIVLNVMHIIVIILGASLLHLHAGEANKQLAEILRTKLAYWLGFFVLVAGAGQVAMLWKPLREVGFQFIWVARLWTPSVRKMLRLSIPVALGAGVLQLSVLMDKGIAITLAQYPARDTQQLITHANLLGHSIRLPMELGATVRLTWAQLLYQFPLGVFAIALATAIFPALSADALDHDRARFKGAMRQGIEATLFEGFAASAGLILVRYPCIRLLFQHGSVTAHDVDLIARSLAWYASAIWAFSLLQIINRAYYAMHDTTTPLVMAIVNIVLNLVVELPLVWWPKLGEAGMAIGTCVSFAIQAVIMLWMLDRRVGGLGLRAISPSILKMLLATALMIAACAGVRYLPGYPSGSGRLAAGFELMIQIILGAIVYCGACAAMGVGILDHILPARLRRTIKAA